MPTAAQMQTRFPDQLGGVPTTVLDAAIAEAIRFVGGSSSWADAYDDAVLYYAAYLAVAGPQAGVQQASAGPVSVTYMSEGGAAGFLKMYERLRAAKRDLQPAFVTSAFRTSGRFR